MTTGTATNGATSRPQPEARHPAHLVSEPLRSGSAAVLCGQHLWKNAAVIIVSGSLFVEPEQREVYLAGCGEAIRLARTAPGCIDFQLSADPLDGGRINVFEQWESAAAVEAFRGSGPSDEQQAMIKEARVFQHEVSASVRL